MSGAGSSPRESRRTRPDSSATDAGAFAGLELPAEVVRDTMALAGLAPLEVARRLGLSDHYELVIRHILGLTDPPHRTRTHVTREHALVFADLVAEVDAAAAARLTSAIEQAEAVWRAEAARQRRRRQRRADASRGARRGAGTNARTRESRRARTRRNAAASQGDEQLERRVPVTVLQRLVERTDATPQEIGHLTRRRTRDVRVMLGLAAPSRGRLRRTVTIESARSIAAALVTLANGPYATRILARELRHAQATTGMRLVEEFPRWHG